MSELITVEQFSAIWFYKQKNQKKKSGNQGNKSKIKYKDLVTAFDIETTRIIEIEQSVMYLWAWQFDLYYTVIGRTWEEFLYLCEKIKDSLQKDERLVVYCHNLSYEFQFLRGIYNFKNEEVFAIKSRKILKCSMFDAIELRCSYLLTNMSLSLFTEKMGVDHRKLDGEIFDYSKRRFYFTPISDYELSYQVNDVLGLVESLKKQMLLENDNLYSIPLTSTGYVRRDAKKAMREVSQNFVKMQLPSLGLYEMLREAFRGGDTHANRFYTGHILRNVKSADRSSSYPEVQANSLFPISTFFHSGAITIETLLDLITRRKKAVVFRAAFTKIELLDPDWGAPYLSIDKCRNKKDMITDNGRILSAAYLETTLTDVDFNILLSQYKFEDIVITDSYHARYGKLPPSLVRCIIAYYVNKTELKDVAGQEEFYTKEKNKLNGVYGMSAQDPVKQSIDYDNGEYNEQHESTEQLLADSNAFMPYQWGVWTTARAREELQAGIREVGVHNFVYCDTDSVKYLEDIDWTEYNNKKIEESKKSGAYATDKNGVTHYMGVYEQEKTSCEFATMGAKKYVTRKTADSPLITTIAGVSKKEGGKELEEAGGISAFKSGFIFTKAGGNELIYNDNPEQKHIEIDGFRIDITANIVIKESTYKLGLAADYERLLDGIKFDKIN